MKEIEEIIKNFSNVKVLVVGDVMLDRYQWGIVSRISPEAPVPIVAMEKSTVVAGGAANVAANVAGLGAKPTLFGITGDDEDAEIFPGILKKSNIDEFQLIKVKNRRTTVKTRIIAHNQQIVRIDQESVEALSKKEAFEILKQIRKYLTKADIIIISDYAKGFLTEEILVGLIKSSKDMGKPVLIDPKGKDYSKYRGATILTPNQKEAIEACNLEQNTHSLLEESGVNLMQNLGLEALLITLGENGVKLFEQDKKTVQINATARNVYDVTGAGDTVIASLAVCLASGMNYRDSAEFANLAAGIVVEHIGTTAINREDLLNSLR